MDIQLGIGRNICGYTEVGDKETRRQGDKETRRQGEKGDKRGNDIDKIFSLVA